ncbi:MAG: rod shape-determining protein MreC [Eubacteriales bacterium]|nr:rod shape-determining protein MreC [Eubacteriales bacterium]
MTTENTMMAELSAENERLTQLLGVTEKYPQYAFIYASVSAREPGSWFMTFQINRGTGDGVDVDMAVVNQDGLVGRVVEAGPNWARVLTIIDTQSAASAIVERTRDHGIVEGSTDPEAHMPECTVQYLPVDSDLAPGDRFITSNLGGIFPKGIVVGTVTEVNRNQNSQSYAIIRPAVDFAHLEDVLVIKSDKAADGADIAQEDGQ